MSDQPRLHILAKSLDKAAIAAVWLKAHGASERALAADLKGYFVGIGQTVTQQVEERIDDLLDEATEGMTEDEIGDLAEEFADDLIDIDEVYDEILDLVRPHIADMVTTGAASEFRLFAPQRSLDVAWLKRPLVKRAQLKADHPMSIDLPPAMQDAVDEYTEQILGQPYWRDVAETVRDDIAEDVRRGVLDGRSGKEIADKIGETMGEDGSEARSNNIARTEATGALNQGHQATRDELEKDGLVKGKTWLSILDKSTRESHEDADGQEVENDAKFTVGEEECLYPGDPDLSAAERCNCRCTATSVTISDEELAALENEDAEKRMKRAKWVQDLLANGGTTP
jgi:hypothetical protein